MPSTTSGGSAAADADTGSHPAGGGQAFAALSLYDGSRKKNAYRDWKREVTAFRLAFNVPEAQLGPRVWLRLTGEARDATEHLDLESDVAQADGFQKLIAALDATFAKEEVDRVDEAVSEFWGCRREFGQSMESYINAMRQARIRMKKENQTRPSEIKPTR